MQSRTGTLVRVLNNNAILVDASGDRVILLGRGIGFGKHLGDVISISDASEIFAPSNALELRQLAEFAREIPWDVFRVARRALENARDQQRPTNQALLLSVADHLHYALERARTGTKVDFPLRWEIAQLYPHEMKLGQETVDLANVLLGGETRLDPDEATAFAMHFVNAQFAATDLSHTVAMTTSLHDVVKVVEEAFGPAATADPTSVARFITHLRYLFARVTTRTQIAEAPSVLLTAVRDAYPEVAAATDQVREVVERGGEKLSDAEVCYLDIHLSRLWSLANSGEADRLAPAPRPPTSDTT